MRKITKHIPNSLTLMNLMSGMLAIAFAMDQRFIIYSPYLIFIGGLFDFCDGFAARLLKAYSPIGKQLDSLADMVTFGVAPSILAFAVMKRFFFRNDLLIIFNGLSTFQHVMLIVCLIFPVFSALRLAKFNIDETQSDSFKGVPTPASAFLLASLSLAYLNFGKSFVSSLVENPAVFILIILGISVLMVSNLRMLSLKFKNYSLKDNYDRYLLVMVAIALFSVWQFESFAFIILFYVLESLVLNLVRKKKV